MTRQNIFSVKDKTVRFWYAIYTKPRFEKKVDSELAKKGLHSYLPLQTVNRVWSDRIKKVQEPLFPSYVFVYADSSERYSAIQTYGALKMVCFNGAPVRIPSEQIESVKRMLMYGYHPEPCQYFNFGDAVEVLYGPLGGLRGYFVERRGKDRFIISIHAIQQSLAIEIERNNVKKAERLFAA